MTIRHLKIFIAVATCGKMRQAAETLYIWICTNTETIKQTVARGRGLAIISKMLIQKEISEGLLRILPIDDLHVTRDIKLIYHRDKFISPLLQTFIEVCQHLS